MPPNLTAALREAYAALDRLPNYMKQAVGAGATMRTIRKLLNEATSES